MLFLDSGKCRFSYESYATRTREDEILDLLESLSQTAKTRMYERVKSLIFKVTKGRENTLQKALSRAASKNLKTVETVQKFLSEFMEENSDKAENIVIKMLLDKIAESIHQEKSKRNEALTNKIRSAIPFTLRINHYSGECSIAKTSMSKISTKALESRVNRILGMEKSSFSHHFLQDAGKYDFTTQEKGLKTQFTNIPTQNPGEALNKFCESSTVAKKISSVYNHKLILYTLNAFNESLLVNHKKHPLLILCNSSSNNRHVGLNLKKLDENFVIEIEAILPLQMIQDTDSENQVHFDVSNSSLNIQCRCVIKTRGNFTASIPSLPLLSMQGIIEWDDI